MNSIIVEDCVSGLKKIEAETIDCVIIDPPYNIGIDFGNNKTKTSLKEYREWSAQWISECERVLKPSGTMFIYGFSEILAHLLPQLNIDSRWLVWHYTNKTVPSLNFWQRSHESVICAWKDKSKRIFNRDDVREPYTDNFVKGYKNKKRKRPGTKGRFTNSGEETFYEVNDKGALPRDVIKVSSLAGGSGRKERHGWCYDCNEPFVGVEIKQHKNHNHFKHPTQKPKELTKKLLDSCLPKDKKSKVLIPFAGTGSECCVVKEMGHDFISFEINEEYARMANAILDRI
jgi:site-specific DNA-methyltransferase (adenine-specific)